MRWQKRQLHHNDCAAGAVSALLRNFSNTLLEVIRVAAMRQSGIASFLCGAEFWTRWDVKRTCCGHSASKSNDRPDSLARTNFVQSGGIMSALRAIQLMGVAAIGVLTGLACLNNLMDYNSNFALVQHVLSMDTTFPEGTLRWRAITSPVLHHTAYWLISATEGVAGAICLTGAYKMLVARNADTDIFNESKNVALWGLGIAFALYLAGFMVIGAEWFAMWQSQRWDGRQPAFRILMCISVVILIVLQEDKKSVAQRD